MGNELSKIESFRAELARQKHLKKLVLSKAKQMP